MDEYNLFLDDIRQPQQVADYCPTDLKTMYRTTEWVVVRNYEEFVGYISMNGLPKMISFDHDLADIHYDPSTWVQGFSYHEKTGYDCAKWLVDYIIANKHSLPEYYVHSQNNVGKENIEKYLYNYKKLHE